MRSSDSSAQPLALLNLGGAYAAAAQADRQQARQLEHILAQFAAACPAYPLGIDGKLAHPWQRHLDAVDHCGGFAARVGQQFLSADRGGLGPLAHWLRSAPPTLQIDLTQIHAVLRREQLHAQIRARRSVDSLRMEHDADAARQEAQATLAHYAETIVPSALHIHDQHFFRLSAWTAMVRADFQRLTALEDQVARAELELELLELEYALAVREGHNDRILSSLETQIATLKLQLDGDPTFSLSPEYPALVAQRAAAQERWGQLAAAYHTTQAVPEQDELAAEIAALAAEIARIEEVSRGLRPRRDEAKANLERSTHYANESETDWQETVRIYHEDIAAAAPAFAALLDQWRALDWAADPRVAAALEALATTWADGSPEDILAALDALGTAVDETYYGAPVGATNDLFMQLGTINDPRIAILEGRRNFEAAEALPGWMKFIDALLVDSATGGFLAYTENQRMLNSPEASASQRSAAKIGLVFDYAGMLFLGLGSHVKAARATNVLVDVSDARLLGHQLKLRSADDMALIAGLMDNGLDQRMLMTILRSGDMPALHDLMRRLRYLDVTDRGVSAAALDKALKQARVLHPDVPFEELETAIYREVLRNSYITGDTMIEGVRRADVDYLFVDQFPIHYQNNLIDAMAPGSRLAVRSRPPGAYKFDNLYPQKQRMIEPEHVLYKYEDGRRIVSVEGKITTVVSDIDIADYKVGDHWVSNNEFIGPGGFMERNTELNGFNNINHGPLSTGLIMDDVLKAQGARFEEFMNEEVYMIYKHADGSVVTDKMLYKQYLRDYNPEALDKINAKQGVR